MVHRLKSRAFLRALVVCLSVTPAVGVAEPGRPSAASPTPVDNGIPLIAPEQQVVIPARGGDRIALRDPESMSAAVADEPTPVEVEGDEVPPTIPSDSVIVSDIPSLEFPQGELPELQEPPTADLDQDAIDDLKFAGGEVVRERYEDGKPKIERQVALDEQGNYVNHGLYQEWNKSGSLVVRGVYLMGVRHGEWIRIYQGNEAPLFKSAPYNQFQAPFTSHASFSGGQLQGVWLISDVNDRTISEIHFETGFRHGPALWRHPSGAILYEANYVSGILDGNLIERDAKGQETKRQVFKQGQRTESEREYYPNRHVKGEYQYLSPPQHLVTPDDWGLARMAVYDKQGDRIKHGPFTTYHENGQIKAKGTYVDGVLDGPYESFHANGQRESNGAYKLGGQHGDWAWWHNNGMRRATGAYVEGRPQGTFSQWQPDGKRVSENPAENLEPIPQTKAVKQQAQRRVPTRSR